MTAGYGRLVMCHMIADDLVELLEMADRIGVDWKWLQYAATPKEHFDIALSKRKLAVAAGGRINCPPDALCPTCAMLTQIRATSMQFVQTLNDFFPLGDTAEADDNRERSASLH